LIWKIKDLEKKTRRSFAPIAVKRFSLWGQAREIIARFACGRFTWISIQVTELMTAADFCVQFAQSLIQGAGLLLFISAKNAVKFAVIALLLMLKLNPITARF
jgi:hypothetical protein